MAPVSGLMVHAMQDHDPRPDLQLSRVTFDILGVIPAEPSEVRVRVVRPGRTIEQLEAVYLVGDRPVVRASAWRLSRQDTGAVAGGEPPPLPSPGQMEPFEAQQVWPGGYIASLETRVGAGHRPGRGQVWVRTRTRLIEGVEVSPTAAFVGLVDTANGLAVRVSPREWMFPNVDLSIHLYRQPVAGWVGFDTRVIFGAEGAGLTTSTLHDEQGPVGQAEQILTVRRLG